MNTLLDRSTKALLFAIALGVWVCVALLVFRESHPIDSYQYSEIHRRFGRLDGAVLGVDSRISALRDRMEQGFQTVISQATSNADYLLDECGAAGR